MGFQPEARRRAVSTSKKNISKKRVSRRAPEKKARPVKKKLSQAKISSLAVDHQELGLKMAWKLLSNWRVRLAVDDVTSIVGLALMEAAHRFDPTKGAAFGTFLFYHIRGLLLKEITNAMNDKNISKIGTDVENYHTLFNTLYHMRGENPLIEHETPEKILQRQELSQICETAYSALDELEQEVIKRHVMNEESLVDISRDLNYCRCHISRVKHSALGKLSDLLLPAKDFDEQGENKLIDMNEAKLKLKQYTGGRGRRKQKVDSPSSYDDEQMRQAG